MNDPHGSDGEKSPEERYRSSLPAIQVPGAGRRAPGAASSIDLGVTGVRVVRLQDISGADLWAEGVSAGSVDPFVIERDLYRSL